MKDRCFCEPEKNMLHFVNWRNTWIERQTLVWEMFSQVCCRVYLSFGVFLSQGASLYIEKLFGPFNLQWSLQYCFFHSFWNKPYIISHRRDRILKHIWLLSHASHRPIHKSNYEWGKFARYYVPCCIFKWIDNRGTLSLKF